MFGYEPKQKYIVLASGLKGIIDDDTADWCIHTDRDKVLHWVKKWEQLYHIVYVREVGASVEYKTTTEGARQ